MQRSPGWTALWYADTVFFFLSLVAFAFMWSRFVIVYLGLGKRTSRTITLSGIELWAFNLAALAANPLSRCFFYFDARGVYQVGGLRDTPSLPRRSGPDPAGARGKA